MRGLLSLLVSVLITAGLGVELLQLELHAQRCTQLNLPENAIARLCPGPVDALAYSPDGKTLASLIHWSPRVALWDIQTQTLKIVINDVNGRTIDYAPDGKTFVCGDIIYNALTGQSQLSLLDGEGYRDFVAYSPDGKTVAGAGPKGIRFWSTAINKPPAPRFIGGTTGSPIANPIATSAQSVPGVRGLSYSPNGKEVAVACALGIWIYDAVANKEIALLTDKEGGHKASVVAIAYSPDGKILASAGDYGGDNSIRLWDAKTKEYQLTLPLPRIAGKHWFYYLRSLSFSADSTLLISTDGSASDNLHLWDVTKAEYKWTLSGHKAGTTSAVFSPDGNRIATSAQDGTILLWDFTSYPIVSISPNFVPTLTPGDMLTFDIRLKRGKNISGYQVTIDYDPEIFDYQSAEYGDYLQDSLPVSPDVDKHHGVITFRAVSSTGTGIDGDGILATVTFRVNLAQSSKLILRDIALAKANDKENKIYVWHEPAEILKTVGDVDCPIFNIKDVNKDCVVNILDLALVAQRLGPRGGHADVNSDGIVDIIDLVLVAGEIGKDNAANAPGVTYSSYPSFSSDEVQKWLNIARQINFDNIAFKRGIAFLELMLAQLAPKETALLPCYPNPFNPETWIPYQLAVPAEVNVTIYSMDGTVIRRLPIGYQPAGVYQNQSKAVHWDGRNDMGERVSSGIYFYALHANNVSYLRKMVLVK